MGRLQVVMVRCGVTYTGRVQGVGFRATARAIASRHAITGWVRNEADGSVQLEAQGTQAEVQGFLADIRSHLGPFIQSVSVSPMAIVPAETGFEIRR